MPFGLLVFYHSLTSHLMPDVGPISHNSPYANSKVLVIFYQINLFHRSGSFAGAVVPTKSNPYATVMVSY